MNKSQSNQNKKDPRNLHKLFVRWGRQRHKLKNQLLVILPQIYESEVWKKYAGTIEEYAGKYGDIGASTVKKRLRLEQNLEGKPNLKAAIKDAGIHIVALVAKLATSETDGAFADKVINMSKSAVQTLSKELRQKEAQKQTSPIQQEAEPASSDITNELKEGSSLCKAVPETIKIELDEEMTFLFLKLKKKMGKHLNNQQAMKIILEEMERITFKKEKKRAIENNKNDVGKSVTGDKPTAKRGSETFSKQQKEKPVTRYITANQKRATTQLTNGKCAYPNCNQPADNLHHINRFHNNKNHASIIPLCKNHHEFTHNGLVQNEKRQLQLWRINVGGVALQEADELYRKYRSNRRVGRKC